MWMNRAVNREAFHIFSGRFAGMVEQRNSQYGFAVRDTMTNEWIVYGENFDLESAVVEVATMIQQLQAIKRDASTQYSTEEG